MKEAKENPWSPQGKNSQKIPVHPRKKPNSLLFPVFAFFTSLPPPRILAKMFTNIPEVPQLRFQGENPGSRGVFLPSLGTGAGLDKRKTGNGRERETEPGTRIPSLGIHGMQAELSQFTGIAMEFPLGKGRFPPFSWEKMEFGKFSQFSSEKLTSFLFLSLTHFPPPTFFPFHIFSTFSLFFISHSPPFPLAFPFLTFPFPSHFTFLLFLSFLL